MREKGKEAEEVKKSKYNVVHYWAIESLTGRHSGLSSNSLCGTSMSHNTLRGWKGEVLT